MYVCAMRKNLQYGKIYFTCCMCTRMTLQKGLNNRWRCQLMNKDETSFSDEEDEVVVTSGRE